MMSVARRNMAGGIVFSEAGEVFLLMTDEGAWIMPAGDMSAGGRSNEVAEWCVEDTAGLQAEIIGIAGNASYESGSRIQWYVMVASDTNCQVPFEQGYLNGGFYSIDAAMKRLTNEQDKDMLIAALDIFNRHCQ